MLTLSRPYAGPILPLCWPYLGLRLPHHVSKFTRTKSKHRHMSFCPFRGTPWTRSLTLGWPYLAPMLAPACPYVGPILALCRPIVATNLPELGQNTFDMSFFPLRGTPWTPKPRKTRGFLIAPRWNSGTAKGTKHRKTRRFWTPCAEYTVNYKGSGTGEVARRWRGPGRRQGRLATITFGYQPKASGKDTGQRPWAGARI